MIEYYHYYRDCLNITIPLQLLQELVLLLLLLIIIHLLLLLLPLQQKQQQLLLLLLLQWRWLLQLIQKKMMNMKTYKIKIIIQDRYRIYLLCLQRVYDMFAKEYVLRLLLLSSLQQQQLDMIDSPGYFFVPRPSLLVFLFCAFPLSTLIPFISSRFFKTTKILVSSAIKNRNWHSTYPQKSSWSYEKSRSPFSLFCTCTKEDCKNGNLDVPFFAFFVLYVFEKKFPICHCWRDLNTLWTRISIRKTQMIRIPESFDSPERLICFKKKSAPSLFWTSSSSLTLMNDICDDYELNLNITRKIIRT